DLRTICLKCLEKNPKKRYASALKLADDLRDFCRGQPIAARPRPLYERAWDAVRSYPRLATAAATAAVLLAGAAVAAFVVAVITDPERPRKKLRATLERGDRYEFTGSEKLPGPFRQVAGKATLLRPDADGGCFSFQTLGTTLWELTDDPMCDRYRF